MYLSKVKLNLGKRKTQTALAALSKLHGAIEESFPHSADSTIRVRKLWKLDWNQEDAYLLVLSSERPDFRELIRQFGYQDQAYEVIEYDRLLDQIEPDSIWRFRLTANPTKSIRQEGKRGKITALTAPEQQMEWLRMQAEKNGFELIQNTGRVVSSGWYIFSKRNERKVRMLAAAFEGYLRVIDPEQLKKALLEGIGREKAYGMGLLTISGTQLKADRHEDGNNENGNDPVTN